MWSYGGKVLIPVQQAVTNLKARLAADISGVSTIIMARTDAESAKLITSDIDPRDKPFVTGERSSEGFIFLTQTQPLSAVLCVGCLCTLC